MNPATYAKAITGGAAAGGGYVIIGWLVGLIGHGIDAIGVLVSLPWLTMPQNVQDAVAALAISAITGRVVWRTVNAPTDAAPAEPVPAAAPAAPLAPAAAAT